MPSPTTHRTAFQSIYPPSAAAVEALGPNMMHSSTFSTSVATPSPSICTEDAEVQEIPGENHKGGRNSCFNGKEGLIILREVCASNALVAVFGTTQKRFQIAARIANENPSMRSPVTWKAVQDHYKPLQELFYKNDNSNQRLYAVKGGPMGELDELLCMIREAREDQDALKNTEKEERKAQDKENEREGAEW